MESERLYPVKAKMFNIDHPGEDFTFQFNPTEIKVSRDVTWTGASRPSNGQRGSELGNNNDSPSSVSPDTGVDLPKYGGTKPYVISINRVLFDTFESRTSVDEYIRPLKLAVTPSVETTAEETTTGRVRFRPPHYIFTFGGRKFDFICAVKSLSWSYSVWLPDGTPLRALVNLVLTETTISKSKTLGMGAQNAIRTGSTFTTANSLGASANLESSFGVSAGFGISAGFELSAGMSGFI